MISQKLREELKMIIEEECGRELTQAEVAEIANNLVGYWNLLARLCHQEKMGNPIKY